MNPRKDEAVYKREVRYHIASIVKGLPEVAQFGVTVTDHFAERCVERGMKLSDAKRLLDMMYQKCLCQTLYWINLPDEVRQKNLVITDTVSYMFFTITKNPTTGRSGLKLRTFYRNADRTIENSEMLMKVHYGSVG